MPPQRAYYEAKPHKALELLDVIDDLRDILRGYYGLASEDSTPEKRLERIAQLLEVPEGEWDWQKNWTVWVFPRDADRWLVFTLNYTRARANAEVKRLNDETSNAIYKACPPAVYPWD